MGNYSSPPPGLSSPSPSPFPPRLPSPPSSSTVPFSWEKQPGVPKPRLQQQQQQPQKQSQKVEKSATFLPLRPPPAPLGSWGKSTPNSCNCSISSHTPSGGHACRKKHHHHAGQHQHVHLSKLFPVVDVGRCQTKVAAANPGDGADDPFSLALARCVEEARRPVTAPFRLPSPTPPRRSSRTAPSAAATAAAAATTWGSSARKTKNSRSRTSGANATGRLSSAFRPLDLYGSCRSSGVSCGSSVVQSTVSIRRRSTSDADYYSHGRHNRQYVAYGILYGRNR